MKALIFSDSENSDIEDYSLTNFPTLSNRENIFKHMSSSQDQVTPEIPSKQQT